MFRVVFFSAALTFTSCFSVSANFSGCANPRFNYSNYNVYGNIYVFDDLRNIAWLIGEILEEDYYNLRQVIRDHEIRVLVLDSPGGNLYESLQMAAVVHDRGIDTYVPFNTVCESACANIFFAGASRLLNGYLGVHQFSSHGVQDDEEYVQLTVSDIIGFLNEFNTPAVVFEKMFQSPEMYYFSSADHRTISRISDPSPPVVPAVQPIECNIVDIYTELGFEHSSEPVLNLSEEDVMDTLSRHD